ncbi:MAG: NACHT domain-containing protein [Cyanobacteria bacterium J06621_8]
MLGDPGAGKTTELICLAKDLIERAINDETAAIPIIFELSSWKEDLSIEDWLVEQLPKKYPGLPKAVAQKWLENQQIIPLLDGLDELGLTLENKCIVAINEFMQSRFQPALIVCCRLEEYEQAQTQLNCLNGAIYLRPLSDEQIQQYLNRLNRSSIWHKTIVNEPNILELARKPLFLTMVVVAYQNKSIKNNSELFEAYIKKQLNNPDNQGIYTPNKSPSQKQTLHYLAWLARKLEAESETEFLIEGLQPTWLESKKQAVVYRLIFGLIFGLGFGLSFGLIFGVIFGLINSDLENKNFPNQGIFNSLKNGLNYGLIVGLIGVLISRLIVVINVVLMRRLTEGLLGVLIGGLTGGLLAGMITGLISAIQHFILRLIFYRNRDIPWNYAKFLDHAAKHRFIQRVGGRYRFTHDLLRKHFAQMPL